MLKSVDKIKCDGKTVLLRCGFDVPIDKYGKIQDDKRIIESLKTIKYLIKKNAKIVIMSHNGRPEGEVIHNLKMDHVAKSLSEHLKIHVKKLDDCVGKNVEKEVLMANQGSVVLLENLRFHKEEESNDDEFAKNLAKLADYYVNDAFSVSHRKHASIVGVPKHIPAYAGFLVMDEINNLRKTTTDINRPYGVIIGGAKTDKIKSIEKILKVADKVIVGGVLANTFLKAEGKNIGASKYDPKGVRSAKKLLKEHADKIMLPVDAVCAKMLSYKAKAESLDLTNIPDDMMIFDVGPQTIQLYSMFLLGCKTIAWAGPIGVFENPNFENGTKEIIKLLAKSSAATIICGGDSSSAVKKYKAVSKMTHVSTGGGASLEFLEGNKLPGISALVEKEEDDDDF